MSFTRRYLRIHIMQSIASVFSFTFIFLTHKGATNFRSDAPDNDSSPLWPDEVSVTEHPNIAREGAHFSHGESGRFLMKEDIEDGYRSICHDNVANV